MNTKALQILKAKGWSLTCAESLTAGLFASTICDCPGASDVFRGGVTTYQNQAKKSVLGVSASRLAEYSPVDSVVAEQMAQGALDLFGAEVSVSTTGVAGPGESYGKPAGSVFISVITPDLTVTEQFQYVGDRRQVREETVRGALQLLLNALEA